MQFLIVLIIGAVDGVKTSKTDTQENDRLLKLRVVESDGLYQFHSLSWSQFLSKIMTSTNLTILLK